MMPKPELCQTTAKVYQRVITKKSMNRNENVICIPALGNEHLDEVLLK